MDFNSMLIALRKGRKTKRKDWNYLPSAYLQISEFLGENFTYIHNTYPSNSAHIIAYGFTLHDIDSEMWCLVE